MLGLERKGTRTGPGEMRTGRGRTVELRSLAGKGIGQWKGERKGKFDQALVFEGGPGPKINEQ